MMDGNERIIALIKFGQRAHMEELFNYGHLFMSSLSNFRDMEEDHLRADKDEAIEYAMPAESAELSIKEGDKWIPIGGLTGSLKFAGPERVRANVFCMHTILASRCTSYPEHLVDPRNFAFGDSFVILLDLTNFCGA
jgi:hypothetical protein